MFRETFPVGLLGCNCTVLADETSREAVVVDPGADLQRILAVVAQNGLRVTRILVTHAHIDHIAGALALKEATRAPILYSQQDLALVALMDEQASWLGVPTPLVPPPDHSPADGETIPIGSFEGVILHTPGHTPGSLSLHIPEASLVLAGDTLFAGSIGRTDLPGGDMRQILRSLASRFLTLPDATVVVPGHGEETTIGEERQSNPFLTRL